MKGKLETDVILITFCIIFIMLIQLYTMNRAYKNDLEEANERIEILEKDRDYLLNEIELMIKNS